MGLTSSRRATSPYLGPGPAGPVSEPGPESEGHRHHRGMPSGPANLLRATWSSHTGFKPKLQSSPRSSARLASRGAIDKRLQGHTSSSRELEQVKVMILEDPNVLKDAQWCAAFVRYLGEGYQADVLEGWNDEPDAVKRASKSQATAQVFFDFWADLTDLEWCHAPSAFHSLRLEAIVDRYLSRGAKTPVPLSESVRSSLLGEDGAGKASQNSLIDARDEAFRYLASEVLPLYVRSTSPVGLPACLHSTKRVVWTLEEAARKISAYPEMTSVLIRVSSSQAFHSYMMAKGEALGHMVMAAIEIMGYKNMADSWALQRWREKGKKAKASAQGTQQLDSTTGDASAESTALFQTRLEITTAHDIFDRSLRLGQTVRRILPSFVVPGLLSAASDQEVLKSDGGALPVTLFDEVLVYLLNTLNGYFPDFHRSPEAANLQHVLDLPTEVPMEVMGERREELRVLLDAPSLKEAFESYLVHQKDPQAIRLLHFYQDVGVLQASKAEMPLAVFSKVVKIFSTYIRRGAPCELALMGGLPRIQVIERLAHTGNISVYDAAQASALDALATQWLPGFVATEWLPQAEQAVQHVQRDDPSQHDASAVPVCLLSSIVESSTALALLITFAASECSPHPVYFWLEAESYRTLPRADLLLARGRAIAEKYIAPGATRAVPLSESVRDRILASCHSELVGPGLFIEAQIQVYEWMENELMPKFVQSPVYQTLAAKVKPPARTIDILSLTGRAGLSEAAITGIGADNESVSGLKKQGSKDLLQQHGGNDFHASTAGEPTFEDVLAVLNQGEHVDYAKLMTRLFDVPITRQYFKEYCKRRAADKVFTFWLDAEDFCKHLPGNRAFRKSQARKLVTKYIADDAPMKVPIQYSTQQGIFNRLESPPRTAFKEAQDEVLSYMANDLLPGFLESPELMSMMEANAMVTGTPWSRMGRRVVGLFKKSTGRDLLSESVSDMGTIFTRSASSDSLASLFSQSSSVLGDSVGRSPRAFEESSNWSQKLSSSFRAVLVPLLLNSSHRRERRLMKVSSESRLNTMGHHASLSSSPLPHSSQSRVSDALPASSASVTSVMERDFEVPSAFVDVAMGATEDGTLEGSTRSFSPTNLVPSSPSWRTPNRVVPMKPFGKSEGPE